MFDPWPTIRKWAKEFRRRGKGGDYSFLSLDETDELLADADVLLAIKNDAELALSELEGYTARQSYGKDSLPVEVKQALMILREALNPFDRKRIGRAALPEHLRRTK